MDKALKQTNKKLKDMEREIGRVYENSSALKRAKKEYMDYMDIVQKRSENDFLAFKQADNIDDREALKKVYMGKIEALTIKSDQYKKIIKRITDALSEANQQALDITNSGMEEIYAINYNEVAEDCKKVGIKVDGEKG